eukprot:502478_1
MITTEEKKSNDNTQEVTCIICYTSVTDNEMLELECCGLKLHGECLRNFIKSKDISNLKGQQISLQQLSCMVCRNEIKSQATNQLLTHINSLRAKIKTIGLNKLKQDGRMNAKPLTEEKGEFYQNAEAYAMKIYSFHICYKCNKPYCSGETNCINEMENMKQPGDYICSWCQKPSITDMLITDPWDAMLTMSGNGLWLCPNNHPYVIAHCIAPNGSGSCNQCGAQIGKKHGATSHTSDASAAGNRLVGKILKNNIVPYNEYGCVSMNRDTINTIFYDELCGKITFMSETSIRIYRLLKDYHKYIKNKRETKDGNGYIYHNLYKKRILCVNDIYKNIDDDYNNVDLLNDYNELLFSNTDNFE